MPIGQLMSPRPLEILDSEHVLAEFDAALQWLTSLSIRVDSTRLAHYRGGLEALSRAIDRGDPTGVLKQSVPSDWGNTALEAIELIPIYRAFGKRTDPEIASRLRQIVSGPLAYPDESESTSSDRARNIAFELHLGALLALSNFDVSFTDEGDLYTNYRGRRVFIECKRPWSERKIEKRVKEAYKQIRCRYKGACVPPNSRGLIGISITKLANPDGKRLYAASYNEAVDKVRSEVDDFIARRRELWRSRSDRRSVGAIIQYRKLVFVENQMLIVPLVESALDLRPNLLPEDQAVFIQFQTRFERPLLKP
jgi:hypothetical protein